MYELRMPRHVIAGEGALEQLPQLAGRHRAIVLVTDAGVRAAGLVERVTEKIHGLQARITVIDTVPAEPDVRAAQQAVDACRAARPDLIIGLGGGSVLDVAKLASILIGGPHTVAELVQSPLHGQKAVPAVLIPTTAGTGSEATANAIVAVPEERVKVGIVNPAMMADAVILSAEMTATTPKQVAAAAAVDAIAHALECYTSKKATPFSDLYAMEAMRLLFGNVQDACLRGDARARDHMLLGAFYAGVAITASGTTAVHALSYPLGGRFHIAHGVANAVLLAAVMRFNEPCCTDRLARVYNSLWVDAASARGDVEKAHEVLSLVEEVVRVLEIPPTLAALGVRAEDLDELVASGMQVTRLLNNNLRTVTPEDARAIYASVLGEGA